MNRGLAAINNIGLGGLNVHILFEPNPKSDVVDKHNIVEDIPRIINICGRTEEGVKYIIDFIQNNPDKISREFLALLAEPMKFKPMINSSGFPFRGINEYRFPSSLPTVSAYAT